MQVLRKIFFYFFLIIYLTLCPVLILYAFGYIFNPQKLGIIQTGLVYLSTVPQQAAVYIGRSHYKEKTPVVLRELIPGKYSLSLQHKDYQPWSKEVNVEAGKTLVFENIMLIPWHWKAQGISIQGFKEIIPMPETHYLLLAGSQKLRDYYVYDLREEKIWPLIPRDSSWKNAKVLAQFIIKGSHGFLLCLEAQGKKKYVWIEPKEKMPKLKDLSSLFPEEPLYLDAEPNDIRYLFSFEKDYLNRVDAAAAAIFPKYLESLRGFGIHNKQLYILTNDNSLQRSNYDKTDREEVAINGELLENPLFNSRSFLRVKVFEKNIFAFWGRKGEFFLHYLSYVFADKGIAGVAFDKESKKLLFWKKDKIGVVDFASVEEENGLLKKSPKPRWLYTNANDISSCFWVLKGSYIIFYDKAGVYLLEAQSYAQPQCAFVTQAKRDSSVFYAEDTGRLYYLEAKTGKLTSLEIIPQSHTGLMFFPEKTKQATDSKE